MALSIVFSERRTQASSTGRIMDPFTNTATAITLITSVQQSLEVSKKQHDIPHDLDALIQETADLAPVLEHVSNFRPECLFCKSPEEKASPFPAGRARSKLYTE